MICEHGLARENCPHCMQNSNIKPPIQLVKVAPREIPMPRPYAEEFNNNPKSVNTPFFAGNRSLASLPNKPQRHLNLVDHQNSQKSHLFHEKKEKLENKYKLSQKANELENKIDLIDLRKKFTN